MPTPAKNPAAPKAVGNNSEALLNATGTALPEQAQNFNPLATWSVGKFRTIAGLQTPFLSKAGNIVSIITKPDGSRTFCGISKNAKKFITEEGFSVSKLFISVMPASTSADGVEYAQGFLMHVAQGSGSGLDFYPEID